MKKTLEGTSIEKYFLKINVGANFSFILTAVSSAKRRMGMVQGTH
jgi:hypothetical protein